MRRATFSIALTLAALGCSADRSPEDLAASTATATATPSRADEGGYGDLVHAPGSELVVQHCVSCHGPRQFLQQRGSRDTWRGLIRWMQRDHGMPPLLEGVEDRIVEYLATHYAPSEAGRRRPLPDALMPPNPYGR